VIDLALIPKSAIRLQRPQRAEGVETGVWLPSAFKSRDSDEQSDRTLYASQATGELSRISHLRKNFPGFDLVNKP
jgi:hypothetical protein